MGRIRTKDIKKMALWLKQRYPGRFSADFGGNKHAVGEMNIADSKRIRNKIAGYITRAHRWGGAS